MIKNLHTVISSLAASPFVLFCLGMIIGMIVLILWHEAHNCDQDGADK